MFNGNIVGKKGISPVVATALLLVVAVVSVVGFSNWFDAFSSKVFSDVEIESSISDGSLKIEQLIGESLYVVNYVRDNLDVKELKIGDNVCILTNLTLGMNEVNVSECLKNLTTKTPDIILITEKNVLEKKVFISSEIFSSLEIPVIITDPSCYDSSNINTTGSWDGCNGMLIVNRSMLDYAIYNNLVGTGEDFYLEYLGTNYTLNDSTYNVFTGQITDMEYLFHTKNNFNANINYWDTSNVTDMSFIFGETFNFNQPLNNWDTSNVIDMFAVFYQANVFNQSLNNWDTSKVTTMSQMFYEAYDFNQPLNNWDTSNVTDMIQIFNSATVFNQDLSSWCVFSIGSDPGIGGPALIGANEPNWGIVCS